MPSEPPPLGPIDWVSGVRQCLREPVVASTGEVVIGAHGDFMPESELHHGFHCAPWVDYFAVVAGEKTLSNCLSHSPLRAARSYRGFELWTPYRGALVVLRASLVW
jgi:hypothetical protein